MRIAILVIVLLSTGCANLEIPDGHVMSTNHRTGKIHFKPNKLIYFPDDKLPRRESIDYSLTMCNIYS